jgi:hypothetical protein
MNALFIILLVIVVLILAVLAWAAVKIPKDWEGIIQKKLPYPLKTVWDCIADIEGTPAKKREIKKIEPLEKAGDNIIKWKEHTDMGGYILFEKYEAPYQQLIKKMIESSFGMTGTWTYNIQGDERQCTVSIIEKSSTKKLFVRLMLSLAGRNANLKREMNIIEKFVSSTSSRKE